MLEINYIVLLCHAVAGVCHRFLDRLREPEIGGLVEAALGLLANLIYDCPENIHKLVKLNGTGSSLINRTPVLSASLIQS